MVPAWCTDFAAMEAHVATYAHPLAVERCACKYPQTSARGAEFWRCATSA